MRKLILLVLLLLALAALPAGAAPFTLHLVSGSAWTSSATMQTGWTDYAFDDSSWSNAYAPYPPVGHEQDVMPGTLAKLMWHYPSGIPNGANGALDTYYRLTFNLPGPPIDGQVLVAADDDYEMFINGVRYLDSHLDGGADIVDSWDITSSLRAGGNIIAIHASDGCLPGTYLPGHASVDCVAAQGPHDRGGEFVLLDATITAVPEPASLMLFGPALTAVFLLRRRR